MATYSSRSTANSTNKWKRKSSSESYLKSVPDEFAVDVINRTVKIIGIINKRDENFSYSLDQFEMGGKIGQGRYGKIYIAREKESEWLVALKKIDLKKMYEEGIEEEAVRREVMNQYRLKHPNILQMYTYFINKNSLFLVLELMTNGDLYEFQMKQPNHVFKDNMAARIITQMASAVDYIHSQSIIHRDIKPENILIDFDNTVKLADFGWSVRIEKKRRQTVCGTLEYMSPEIIEGRAYGKETDIWSLGILCFEMLVGVTPFIGNSHQVIRQRISTVDLHFPQSVSQPAQNLICKLLQYEPQRRISLKAILSHRWVLSHTKTKIHRLVTQNSHYKQPQVRYSKM